MVIFLNLDVNQRLPPVNKQKFVEYLRQPAALDGQSISDLESVLEEYPYFQNARTLIAKGSKQLKSKKASLYVNSAAIYATDRALLKRYINDQLIFLSPLEVHESHEAEHERELTDTIKSSRVANAKVKQVAAEEKAPPKKKVIMRPKPEEEAPKETAAPEEFVLEENPIPTDLDNIIEELYKDLEELKENRAKLNKIENDLAEQEDIDKAVEKATKKATSPTKKEESAESKEPEEEKEEPKKAKSEDKPKSVEVTDVVIQSKEDPQDIVEEKDSKSSEEEEEVEEKEKPKRASQSRSARRTTKLKKESSEDAKETPKKSSKTKTSKESSKAKSSTKSKSGNKGTTKKETTAKKSSKSSKDDDSSDSKGEKGEKPGKPAKSDQESIIANFIKTNPSISPADGAKIKVSSDDLSTGSSELHPDIASEYLAEIYLEQGSHDRAIQIYEALIVRFPEKSVYFADIIKKINEQR